MLYFQEKHLNNINKKSVAQLKSLKIENRKTSTALILSEIIYYKISKNKIMEKCDLNETKNSIMKEDFISTIKNAKAENI